MKHGHDNAMSYMTKLNSLTLQSREPYLKISFITSNDIVQSCQLYINFADVDVLLTYALLSLQKKKFLVKFCI